MWLTLSLSRLCLIVLLASIMADYYNRRLHRIVLQEELLLKHFLRKNWHLLWVLLQDLHNTYKRSILKIWSFPLLVHLFLAHMCIILPFDRCCLCLLDMKPSQGRNVGLFLVLSILISLRKPKHIFLRYSHFLLILTLQWLWHFSLLFQNLHTLL